LFSTDGAFYKKRYKVKLSLENEANMMSIINKIINGTIAYNKRDGTLTEVSVMSDNKFVYSNKSWIEANNRCRMEYELKLKK